MRKPLFHLAKIFKVSIGFQVSSQYSGDMRPELVEGRWLRQAQPTPPRFFEKIRFQYQILSLTQPKMTFALLRKGAGCGELFKYVNTTSGRRRVLSHSYN
jgi:hypothetical protein